MSQPIDVGTILGGRYKVTELVLTSADGDVVLGGMDQVLNREVSILVASPENASQVATSAREIATGERYGAMQVLDLGISDGSTYLITNTANSADLLDLVIQRDAPFVEPFYTDTLGSEIFGVSRSAEPEVYDDEEEYWEELAANEEKNVGGRVAKGLTGFKDRFGKGRKDEAAAGGAAAAAAAGSSAGTADSPGGDGLREHPRTAAEPQIPPRPQTSPSAPETAAGPAARPETGPEKVSHWGEAETDQPSGAPDPRQGHEDIDTANGQTVSPAGAASAAAAAAHGARIPAGEPHYQRPAAVFPAGARNFSGDYTDADYDDDTDDGAAGGGGRFTRLLVGALLVVVLVVAVVFAFNTLGKNDTPPVAEPGSQSQAPGDASSGPASESAPSSSPKSATPEVTDLTRLVPGNQALNAETDSTLQKAIDGSQGSIYRSYTYTTPQFGGFASNMVLVVKLKDEAPISEVELSGLNGTGGAFQVSVGDSDDLGAADEVTSGSFTGPTVTVPVAGDGDDAVNGRYVFINVTELPKLASTSNGSRPYGLQIAEIKVS